MKAKEWYKEETKNDLLRKIYSDLDYQIMERYAEYKNSDLIKDIKDQIKKNDKRINYLDGCYDRIQFEKISLLRKGNEHLQSILNKLK